MLSTTKRTKKFSLCTSSENGSSPEFVTTALPAALCGVGEATAARAVSRGSTIAAALPDERIVICRSEVM